MCIRFSQFVHICCTLHINSLQGATYVNKLTKSSACRNNLCVLDGIGCIVMAHLDSLLPQARAQQVGCYYGHVQVELQKTPTQVAFYLFFFSKKKKEEVCVCVQIKLMLTNFALCRLVQIEDSCQQVGCCLLHFGNEKY